MPRSIYKFELFGGLKKIELPPGAKPLSVHVQSSRGTGLFAVEDEKLCMWVEGNFPGLDDAYIPSETRTFLVAGTGHTLPDNANLQFIGTVLMKHDTLVFHVFEVVA